MPSNLYRAFNETKTNGRIDVKLSHILIKVNNLDKAVKEWEEKGFIVEYGKAKRPYNALIYFKDGAFIELFQFNGLPKVLNILLKLLGKRKFVEKMDFWANHDEGLLSIMLENYDKNLDKEIAILKNHGLTGVLSNKTRKDVKNRKLDFKVLFTNDVSFPDLMTFFSVNPKPQENIHPNGIKGVKSISLGLIENQKKIFTDICDDKTIILFNGQGIKDLEWIEE